MPRIRRPYYERLWFRSLNYNNNDGLSKDNARQDQNQHTCNNEVESAEKV